MLSTGGSATTKLAAGWSVTTMTGGPVVIQFVETLPTLYPGSYLRYPPRFGKTLPGRII